MADERPGPVPGPPRALPVTDVLVGRISWMIRLRWLAVVGTFVFVEAGRFVLPIRLHTGPLCIVLAALAAYNLLVTAMLRRRTRRAVLEGREARPSAGRLTRLLLPATVKGAPAHDRRAADAAVFAFGQILADLGFLAVLLHFAGGIENPLRIFFVFHVIIASVLLSRLATYAVAAVGSALLSGVALAEGVGWLPHYSLDAHWRPEAYQQFGLVGAQLFLLAVALFVAAYLASSIAGRLRRREVEVYVLSGHLADEAARLETAYRELSVAERAKSQYMRKVAHELREPLGTIKTALTVAMSGPPDSMPGATRELIQRAERRTAELAEMTRELLSLSRARGGRAVSEMRDTDLLEVARPVLEEMRARARDAGLGFTAELPPGLPTIVADAEGIADLLTNLVGNAIRYTPAGGSVRVSVAAQQRSIALEVSDTGIGIPADDLPRIYDEFYRSPRARQHAAQGSGLGLAIVRAVVDQHAGTITVHSEVGRGTTFRVELPVSAPAVPGLPIPPQPTPDPPSRAVPAS